MPKLRSKRRTGDASQQPRAVCMVSEAAKTLGISEPGVLALIDDGSVGAINVGGSARKAYRIILESLDAYVSRGNRKDAK